MLSNGAKCTVLRAVVLTIPACDGQTDRRTDGIAVANTSSCNASIARAVKNDAVFAELAAIGPYSVDLTVINIKLECGPMPNVMVALPNTGGALCATPQSLADAHY